MKTFMEFLIEAKVTDKKHIQNYTDLSRPLTRHLYQSHKAGVDPNKHFESDGIKYDLDALDRISTKSGITRKTQLYSGVKHSPATQVDHTGHMRIPSYTSTSELESVAHRFAVNQARKKSDMEDAHVIRFNLNKGDRTSGNLSSKSSESREQEHLLPRNIKVKINPVPETTVHSSGRKIHTWDAHIVKEQ